MAPREFAGLLKASVVEWSADNASRLSAALAYYTIFSLAPLLVIILGLVGWIFGGRMDSGQMVQQLGDMVGPQAASVIQGIVRSAHRPGTGIIAQIVSIVVLFVGASGVFFELHTSLNTIWEVRRKSAGGIFGTIKARLSSFLIIFVIGLFLIAAVGTSAAVSAFGRFLESTLPGANYVLYVANFLLSFVLVAVLFAIIYKMLPDAEIKWSDVWVGAGVTSLLFAIGKLAIGLYLGKSTMGSLYGAAGSLIIFLAFIYYSAQIFFFGAEFTQIYANRYGSRIIPSGQAEATTGEEPAAENRPSAPSPEEKRDALDARGSRKR